MLNPNSLLELHLHSIYEKVLVKVTFQTKLDGEVVTRSCAPMDYGDSRRTPRGINYFHFIDLDSPDPGGPHPLRLEAFQILGYEVTSENFDPEMLVTWAPNWWVRREWGTAS